MDPVEVYADPVDAASHGSQSFIVHLWREDPAPAGSAAASTWRGHVTDVQTREQRAVDSLSGIVFILATRLVEVGFLLRWYERFCVFLMRVKR